MIIYGSRMYGTRNVVLSQGVCDHCGRLVRHKSYDARKWGHLYFIPLIPCGGHVRVLKECPQCKMGQHMPREQADKLYSEIEKLIEPCVLAAGSGEHHFQQPGENEPTDTGPFLTSAVDLLYVSGHQDDVPGILKLLEDDGATYEHAVAESAYLDLQGWTDKALARMEDAAEAWPEASYPRVMLATFAARTGNSQAQLDYLRQASDLVGGNDPGLLLEMAGPLEALKRYDELTDLLENCIRLVPELGQDKKFMKLHKKYAKKAVKAR